MVLYERAVDLHNDTEAAFSLASVAHRALTELRVGAFQKAAAGDGGGGRGKKGNGAHERGLYAAPDSLRYLAPRPAAAAQVSSPPRAAPRTSSARGWPCSAEKE